MYTKKKKWRTFLRRFTIRVCTCFFLYLFVSVCVRFMWFRGYASRCRLRVENECLRNHHASTVDRLILLGLAISVFVLLFRIFCLFVCLLRLYTLFCLVFRVALGGYCSQIYHHVCCCFFCCCCIHINVSHTFISVSRFQSNYRFTCLSRIPWRNFVLP